MAPASRVSGDSGPRVGAPGADQEIAVSVVRRRLVADDVLELALARPTGQALPQWTPGAHVDVLLPGGMVRQYSLCGDPAQTGSWRIGVLREPAGRGGSAWLHDHAVEGTELVLRGPRNNFPLDDADRYVFVAGGVGITPVLTMVHAAERAGRPWVLWYGGRRRSSMAFLDELTGYGDRVRLRPEDESGQLDLATVLADRDPGTLFYCCGPPGLIDAMRSRCQSMPAGNLRVERFSAVPQPAADEPDGGIEVICQRSGLTVAVPPGLSILDAVRQAGVDVLSSCTEGICGTCETTVLDGVPAHRDSLLTEDEQEAGDTMMICVSRALGDRLVLDL
ncbi:PDR/VanB family oxidoreductase [Plantactinospora soyae]|uniref:Ferredoxin-NADP reductase n=1 Tax=Plantactinospora soyae TaxID=1544732 RepID=A0A927R1J1_9ACTN|nr:PDR/VanB family oxidoreductase [Plantactinospora soyae]MBE1489778.1 ferredoxin-NADP reductase [Plantactinospora soyae]